MGGSESTKRKVYLTAEDIEKISTVNSTLQIVYNQHKNSNGFINIKDLETIFDNKVDFKIVKKLYKIFSMEKNKFSFEDLKYLYAMFFTDNYEAKLNFFADLIFVKNSTLTLDKYKTKIKLIFYEHTTAYNKLSSPNFISNMTNNDKISKDNFIKNLDRDKGLITNFQFFADFDNINNLKGENNKLILSSNSTNCECINKLSKQRITETFKKNTSLVKYK